MEARYDEPPKLRQPIGQQDDKFSVDGVGSAFTNDDYRSAAAVTIGTTPLPYPCDALNLSVASTLSVLMREDPVGEEVTIILPAGISKVSVKKVLSATGGAAVVALYHRRPVGEP